MRLGRATKGPAIVLPVILLFFAQASLAEVVVIAGKSFPLAELTVDKARDIFLGKIDALSGGIRLRPQDLPRKNHMRDEFYTKVVGKNEKQLRAYWRKAVFSERATPPTELENEAAVKEWVSSKSGAIGYVDRSAVDGSVKVLLRVE